MPGIDGGQDHGNQRLILWHIKRSRQHPQRPRQRQQTAGRENVWRRSGHAGSIIVRQRGTKFCGGRKRRHGRDWTLFALVDGKIAFDKNGRRVNVKANLPRRINRAPMNFPARPRASPFLLLEFKL